MDLNKIKPEKISDDAVDKIDDYENDQLGTLKIKRRWESDRDEFIKSLRMAAVKVKRAKKMNKDVCKVFQVAQDVKKEKDKKKKDDKKDKNLKEFLDIACGSEEKKGFNINNLKLDELKSIHEFVKYISPIISKKNKELKGICDTWEKTMARVVDNYPKLFDDYAKEVVRQILDAIFEFEDQGPVDKLSKSQLTTSPFFSSQLDIATISNKGDYENM